jgi:hypothetical protein
MTKFYLEYFLNGKEIKEIYESVNKDTFVVLHGDIFKESIKENMEIDQDELIKGIKSYIVNSNNLIMVNFKSEKEKYENILKNKIYKEFYTRENLEKKLIQYIHLDYLI